ncbi:hypothetical protein PCE1_000658 [Barthelona sp. PCE]
MREIERQFDLSEEEKVLFEALIQTKTHFELETVIRVAGGWVRDKLLNRVNKYDVDLALSDISGQEFANKFVEYLSEFHPNERQKFNVIKANPDQSKHLETATGIFFGIDVDFVCLRNEEYTSNSRIPVTTPGTASSDALRRDLTINSLFYNIESDTVEDYSEMGLQDLEIGIVRTPLDPVVTFNDDPLRILRSIRFACRLDFDIDPCLLDAAKQDEIRDGFMNKISKERVFKEISEAFITNAIVLLEVLVEINYLPIVFGVEIDGKGFYRLYNNLKVISSDGDITKQEKDSILMTYLSFIYLGFDGDIKKYLPVPKTYIKMIKKVNDINSSVWSHHSMRQTIGQILHIAGEFGYYAIAVLNAVKDMEMSMTECLAFVEEEDLEYCMTLKPKVNGNELINRFNRRRGRWMKECLDLSIMWQIDDPNVEKEELFVRFDEYLSKQQ